MKISNSLKCTKSATFAVTVPNPNRSGFPTPVGTGFLVSSDGWFVTAAHVLTVLDKERRSPVDSAGGTKEFRLDVPSPYPEALSNLKLKHFDLKNDFALLKADYTEHSNMEWLNGRDGFPFIQISEHVLDEGDDVYAFGYPLSQSNLLYPGPEVLIGGDDLHPRVTSSIVASHHEKVGAFQHGGPQQTYVLDKALNYGNSGGPIVAVASGHAHAFCSRFQPVYVPQPHLGEKVHVMIPSLYGVVTSFSFPQISDALRGVGIEIKSGYN